MAATYSAHTVCPACVAKTRREDVRFTPRFSCPNCGKGLCISGSYRRTMNYVVYLLSFLIPYALGVRSWFLLLSWLPSIWVLAGIWAYVGKYFLPPKLE